MTELLSRTGPARPGIYPRGTETVDLILKAALDVLIEEGAARFTLRRIAARCGMKAGNLSYHFPKKELLIQLLLEEMLVFYEALLDETVRRPGLDAEARLATLIDICLDDIASERTTHFFTELWALSNHNGFVADRVAAFYRHAHGHIAATVAPLNPALSPDDVAAVALYISATLEGTTIFIGHGRAWAGRRTETRGIARATLMHLAKTITPADIRRFAG